jgi:hypothetical protein
VQDGPFYSGTPLPERIDGRRESLPRGNGPVAAAAGSARGRFVLAWFRGSCRRDENRACRSDRTRSERQGLGRQGGGRSRRSSIETDGAGGAGGFGPKSILSFGRNAVRPSSRGFGPAERIDPDGLNSIRSLARPCRAGLGLSGWIGWAGLSHAPTIGREDSMGEASTSRAFPGRVRKERVD